MTLQAKNLIQLNQPTRCSKFLSLLHVVLILQQLQASTTTATAVFVAPDDGHEDARNMLSCI
jgi:hypothetical protein